ncbi:MAG TPA: carbohydrate binding domain-containing protein [Terriglobales bacterium]|jgi:tetratricopeptide (TPR) repeat protein|nr:carbohydrate binding domain-containing protein [Terriglobales bacterium]
MQISLHSPAKKILLLSLLLLVVSAYVGFAVAQYLAARLSQAPDLASLQRAVRLQPGNADYRYQLGRYFFIVQRKPEPAVAAYQAAIALNPHEAHYWLDLAAAYALLGDSNRQEDALERALVANPRSPDVAWEAANLGLVRGETDQALREFRVVLENEPTLAYSALQLCWRARPDTDALLRDVVPPIPDVYASFLTLLTAKKETAAAARVWAQLVWLQLPIQRRYVFDYIRYLVGQRDADQARLVWQQAASLSGLSAYQPSPENLVINGDFSLDVLNGGFDWLYLKSPDVLLALDPTQSHSGHRSLSITFETAKIEDAGIRQLIPVQPNTHYNFSAYFRAEDIEGAGGPRLAIQDLFTQSTYFASEELKDASFWKQVAGSFTTGPDSKLLVLRVQRVPAGSPIKGRLWIDSVRLVEGGRDDHAH